MQKYWFAIFKVKVTPMAHILSDFLPVYRTADPFTFKLRLMVHYCKLECLIKGLDCCVQGDGEGSKLH